MPARGVPRWLPVLAISLAGHGLGLWLVDSTRTPLRPQPSPRFTLVPFEPAPPPAVEAPPASPSEAKKTRRRVAPPSAAEATVAPGPGPQGAVAQTGPEAQSPATPFDAPREASRGLGAPRAGVIFGLGASQAEPSHGSTLSNGPGEEEDRAIAREVEGERLTRTLNAQLLGDVGVAMVGAGTVPGHFRRAETSLREALGKLKVDRTPLTAKEVVEKVAKTMFASGISAEAARKVADSPLGNSVAHQTVSVPNTDDNRFREQGLQLMAGAEALKERARAAQLKTVLQLTTDPSGAVAEVTVVERSGDPRFDESVLHLSRKVFRHLPDDDEKALGTSWWKTKWQFTYEPPDVRVRLLDAHRIP